MQVEDFIIHEIHKTAHAPGTPNLRTAPIPLPQDHVTRFTEQIVESFAARHERPTNIYASFHSDTHRHPFSDWCRAYLTGALDLVRFSTQCVERLLTLMNARPGSTGGYTAFARFTQDGQRKLMVVMLHPHDGLTIDENLNLVGVSHLELRHIDKAALITEPTNGRFDNKALVYAGFRKEMSLYFQQFLGPDEYRNPTRDTRELVKVIDQFAQDQNLTPEQRADFRGKIRDYSAAQLATNQELDLRTIANLIAPAAPQSFIQYATQEGISAVIRADPAIFKRWRLVRHADRHGVLVQFPAELCGLPGTHHPIHFDRSERTLTFRDLDSEWLAKIEASIQ